MHVCLCAHVAVAMSGFCLWERRESLTVERKADEKEVLREERGKKWKWVRALQLRDWRGESQKALECFWPFVQPNCIYIQACHYLSEVTGKDSMIYQIGRLQALSCYWIEQRGVRESERAQNGKSDQVIGFLPTSHSSLALWLSLLQEPYGY